MRFFVGINLPMHPNCRSLAVIDRKFTQNMTRMATDPKTGETQEIPYDMGYREWEAWQKAGAPKDVKAWREKNAAIPEEKAQLKTRNKNTVQLKALDAEGFTAKFNGITGNAGTDKAILESATEMLQHANGTNHEDLHLIDMDTGSVLYRHTSSHTGNAVNYNDELLEAIDKAHKDGKRILAIHNHPNGLPPSLDDGASALERGYAKGVVVGHNLEVWEYTATTMRLTEDQCKTAHDKFSCVHEFDVDFEEEEWYNALKAYGMKVKRHEQEGWNTV